MDPAGDRSLKSFGSASHLAQRFVTSLWPGGPKPADDAWARSYLNQGEQALWSRMSGPDRRHAVGVAKRVQETNPAIVPAALLHDVGKVASNLGTLARAATTVIAMAIGRDRVKGRMASYLRHDAIGATLLERANSDPPTIAWAREHHQPATRWTVPREVGATLKAADDD